VAELRKPGSGAQQAVPRDDFERRIMPWVEAGRATLGRPNDPSLYTRSPIRCPRGTAERLLNELRSDR